MMSACFLYRREPLKWRCLVGIAIKSALAIKHSTIRKSTKNHSMKVQLVRVFKLLVPTITRLMGSVRFIQPIKCAINTFHEITEKHFECNVIIAPTIDEDRKNLWNSFFYIFFIFQQLFCKRLQVSDCKILSPI